MVAAKIVTTCCPTGWGSYWACLRTSTSGFCDGYEVASLSRYETELSAFMRDKHGAVLTELVEKKTIDDAMKAKLTAALEEFRGVFRE